MNEAINLLVIATVIGGQASTLTERLTAHGFVVTEINSQVSLVEQTVSSLLIGTQRERLDELMELIRHCCPEHIQYVPARLEPAFNAPPLMMEALQGGATIFAIEVERTIQF